MLRSLFNEIGEAPQSYAETSLARFSLLVWKAEEKDMPVEQTIAAALAALATPGPVEPLAAPGSDAFSRRTVTAERPLASERRNPQIGFAYPNSRLSFAMEGPRRPADSPAAQRFAQETRNLSKTFRGAPRPAIATFRIRISL